MRPTSTWLPPAGAQACDNYLGRVTKAQILAAVDKAKGSEVANRIAAMKKGDMAKEAERLLEGSGWLAEPLRTPAAIESGWRSPG